MCHMNNWKFARTLLLFTVSILLFESCKPEQPEDEETYDVLPVIYAPGCYVQSILDDQSNPMAAFTAPALYPQYPETYIQVDPVTGDILHTYEYKYYYNTSNNLARIDTAYHYYGEFYVTWSDMKLFYYTELGDQDRLDSVEVYVPDTMMDDGKAKKGTLYYERNNLDLVDSVYYEDNPSYNGYYIYDNYTIVYQYDNLGNIVRIEDLNYNNTLTYYEEYVLSPYYQSNYFYLECTELAEASKYAPYQTTAWYQGTGTYVYHYDYQTNEHNFIVEQDLISNGDTIVLKWFNYTCVD